MILCCKSSALFYTVEYNRLRTHTTCWRHSIWSHTIIGSKSKIVAMVVPSSYFFSFQFSRKKKQNSLSFPKPKKLYTLVNPSVFKTFFFLLYVRGFLFNLSPTVFITVSFFQIYYLVCTVCSPIKAKFRSRALTCGNIRFLTLPYYHSFV